MRTPSRASIAKPPASAGGFTLVELITVVLLLGILSAFAASRMLGANVYTPALVAGDVMSVTRLAQQTAMSRQDAVVSAILDPDASDWRTRVVANAGAGDTTLYTSRMLRRNSGATVVNGASSLTVTAANPLRVVFDGAGNVASATVGATALDPSLGIRVEVSGDTPAYVLCVAPTGFVQRGTCA